MHNLVRRLIQLTLIALIVAFVLLWLERVPPNYPAALFGLVLVLMAIELYTNPRPLDAWKPWTRPGSMHWRIMVGGSWTLGLTTIYMSAGWYGLGMIIVVAMLGGVIAVLRVPQTNRNDQKDPLQAAEVYVAYGRTEQAIAILEDALRRSPQRQDISQKLHELKINR